MAEIFLEIVNMSISASWLVLTVMVLRRLMGRAPKWINVLLWGIVAVRLMCPFSIESVLSLIPSAETIPESVMTGSSFNIQTGIGPVDNRVNEYLDSRYFEGVTVPADQGLNVVSVLTVIWLAGMALMLVYTAVSYWRLRRRVDTAVRLEGELYVCEAVASPFVLGIFRPRIYLPWGMDEGDMAHVIAHERTHIRRKDHWWKPLGFLLLTIYWFNPLMWAAYVLLCRDIELACDERVVRELGRDARADYSQALLKCSVDRRAIAACPLAFGEVGVKERVKNVLNYKKPAFWLIAVAIVVCAVVAVCFLTDPLTEKDDPGGTFYFGTVEDSAMSVVHEGDREGRAYITLQCDDGTEQLFWLAEECEEPEDLVGKHVCVRVHVEEGTGLLTASRISVTEQSMAGDLDTAITQSVRMMNQSERYDDLIQCVSYEILSQSDHGIISQSGEKRVEGLTVYLHVLHQVYSVVDGGLEAYAGCYIPTVLTFGVSDAGEYVLTSYWTPRDGAYYEPDIRAKFGIHASKALDGQAYYNKLNRQCYIQALEAYGQITDADGMSLTFCDSDSPMITRPTVTLFPGGGFQFVFSLYSNYIGHGSYAIEEEKLYLHTDDGTFVYVFDIMPGGLIFDGEQSSDMVWFSDLTDGAVLEQSGKSILPGDPLVIGETYVSSSCLYMSMLSSYIPWGGDSECLYTVGEDTFTISLRQRGDSLGNGSTVVEDIEWRWRELPWTEKEFPDLYRLLGLAGLNQALTEVQYQPITDGRFLLNVNGTLMLVEGWPESIWSVYTLVPQSSMGSARWEFEPASSAGYPGFRFEFDGECTSVDVSCVTGILQEFDGGTMAEATGTDHAVVSWEPDSVLYWCPSDWNGNMVNTDEIELSVWQGEKLAAQARVYITSEPNGNLGGRVYTASIVGQGFHIGTNSDAAGAVITFTE